MSNTQQSLTIRPAGESSRSQATALVFGQLQESERAELLKTLLGLASKDSNPFAGLLEARRGESLVGAIWAQTQPGNVAVLWPPETVAHEPSSTSEQLLSAAVEFLESAGVTMAQTLLQGSDDPQRGVLELAGFSHFADLHYMACTHVSFPSQLPNSVFAHLPYSAELDTRFRAVIDKTYEATLDCPALNGVRSIEDVLAGYRSTGVYRPENWRLIVDGSTDVGCLILADHPNGDQLELVYMGVVPEARGRRLGYELTRYAQWITHCAGRSRLVLAVDAKNRPAIDAYIAAGFFSWDRTHCPATHVRLRIVCLREAQETAIFLDLFVRLCNAGARNEATSRRQCATCFPRCCLISIRKKKKSFACHVARFSMNSE